MAASVFQRILLLFIVYSITVLCEFGLARHTESPLRVESFSIKVSVVAETIILYDSSCGRIELEPTWLPKGTEVPSQFNQESKSTG